MSAITDRIYAHSPVWIQNIGISAFGYVWRNRRFGGVFPATLHDFKAREHFSSEQWAEYQTSYLRKILNHSLKTVFYYKNKLIEAGISDKELGSFELSDLARIPLLKKEDIRKNLDKLFSTSFINKKVYSYLTSGSTGTPIAIKFSPEMHQTWSAAYEARCRNWAGLDNKMSRAMIGGRLVVPKGVSKPPFWRYNLVERQLYMSAFHISPAHAPLYVQALNKYRPDYIVGYASSWFFLSRMIVEQKLQVYMPKAVLTSSEKLTDEMRTTIEQAFRRKVYDAYSGVEACCLASECEHHRLHISPDVGIIELLDQGGKPVPPGQPGEIVATGLLNFTQPLIRYRTGDMAIISNEDCTCGRQMPVLKELVGRTEDTVIGPDGREMVRFHGIFVGLSKVKEGQIIQESLTEFRVKLVVDPDFGEQDRKIILKRFEDRLGAVQVLFDFVDKIDLTERGKFRAVISRVNRR